MSERTIMRVGLMVLLVSVFSWGVEARTRVVLYDFFDLSQNAEERATGKEWTTLLRQTIQNVSEYSVVDSPSVAKELEKVGLSSEFFVSEKEGQEVASQLGADMFVLPSYNLMDTEDSDGRREIYTISLEFRNAQTGEFVHDKLFLSAEKSKRDRLEQALVRQVSLMLGGSEPASPVQLSATDGQEQSAPPPHQPARAPLEDDSLVPSEPPQAPPAPPVRQPRIEPEARRDDGPPVQVKPLDALPTETPIPTYTRTPTPTPTHTHTPVVFESEEAEAVRRIASVADGWSDESQGRYQRIFDMYRDADTVVSQPDQPAQRDRVAQVPRTEPEFDTSSVRRIESDTDGWGEPEEGSYDQIFSMYREGDTAASSADRDAVYEAPTPIPTPRPIVRAQQPSPTPAVEMQARMQERPVDWDVGAQARYSRAGSLYAHQGMIDDDIFPVVEDRFASDKSNDLEMDAFDGVDYRSPDRMVESGPAEYDREATRFDQDQRYIDSMMPTSSEPERVAVAPTPAPQPTAKPAFFNRLFGGGETESTGNVVTDGIGGVFGLIGKPVGFVASLPQKITEGFTGAADEQSAPELQPTVVVPQLAEAPTPTPVPPRDLWDETRPQPPPPIRSVPPAQEAPRTAEQQSMRAEQPATSPSGQVARLAQVYPPGSNLALGNEALEQIGRNPAKLREARQYFQQALDAGENPVHAYPGLGKVYAYEGDRRNALTAFDRGLAMDPDSTELWYNRGIVHMLDDQFDKAATDFRRVVSIYPNDTDARLKLAKCLAQTKDYNSAIEQYQILARQQPENPEIYRNMGICYAYLRQGTQAVQNYQRALALKPDDHDTLRNLGLVYYQMKDFEKARQVVNRSLELNPQDENARTILRLIEEQTRSTGPMSSAAGQSHGF